MLQFEEIDVSLVYSDVDAEAARIHFEGLRAQCPLIGSKRIALMDYKPPSKDLMSHHSFSTAAPPLAIDAANHGLERLLARRDRPCNYFLVSELDSIYSTHMARAVAPFMKGEDRGIINFGFLSHKMWKTKGPGRKKKRPVKGAFEVDYIELGTAFISAKCLALAAPDFIVMTPEVQRMVRLIVCCCE